ncbi:hypothetical protein Golob_002390 [Gossypium lobatum]|uniref:Retrotransposon gag domain-containing protein n=1 Tax=Gossypium lobatum TaxID=34289 RepID=A0A7J8N587_9ROSI|nr:hypothetical protein [Gossypium lobatum]
MMSKIEEFEGQFIMYGVVVGKGMLASIPKQLKIDVPKLKEFKGMRSRNEIWLEFQNEFQMQFQPQYAEEEARSKLRWLTQQGIAWEYVWEFIKLLLQILDLSKNEAFYKFKDGLKPWMKKDKFEFSKPKEIGNGKRDHEKEQYRNENNYNCKNGGNGKPPNG